MVHVVAAGAIVQEAPRNAKVIDAVATVPLVVTNMFPLVIDKDIVPEVRVPVVADLIVNPNANGEFTVSTEPTMDPIVPIPKVAVVDPTFLSTTVMD